MIRFADGSPVPAEYLDRLTGAIDAAVDADPGEEHEPAPRQAVTPAGTAYLLPGFDPAPLEKGGATQHRMF